MTDLAPLTALGALDARSAGFGALTLHENSTLALASLALRKGQAAPAPFGLALPGVGEAVRSGTYGAFWTGVGQWMIEGDGLADTDFAAQLKAEAPDQSVTEQTDGWTAFEITSTGGQGLIDALMRKLVMLDPRTFGPGQAARTGLEHMGVFVIRRSHEHLTVIGMRTLADSLWHALTQAARRLAATD